MAAIFNVPYVPVTEEPTPVPLVTIVLFELSFPEATPVTTKTLSASSLSATLSCTSPELVPPADTVEPTVVSVTFGAALTDMVIVYAEELYSVPS